MLIRLLGHVRSNVIAYLALCISLLGLAGGAYAALKLPANSVGARQIRNGSIGPVKLDHSLIGGSIRAWAQVDAQGHVVSSSSGAHEMGQAGTGGEYLIAWRHGTFSKRCAVIATTGGWLAPAAPPGVGSASAWALTTPKANLVHVQTVNAQQQRANMAFSLAIVC